MKAFFVGDKGRQKLPQIEEQVTGNYLLPVAAIPDTNIIRSIVTCYNLSSSIQGATGEVLTAVVEQ